jgi:alanyl-tRNA synthetase
VVARLSEDSAARRKDLDRLLATIAHVEAARLTAAQPTGPVRTVVAPPAPGAPSYLKALASAIAAAGRIALLGAVEDGRAHLAFARSRGSGPHLGELVRSAAAALGGKGGGAPEAAQGSGPAVEALEAALDAAARTLD